MLHDKYFLYVYEYSIPPDPVIRDQIGFFTRGIRAILLPFTTYLLYICLSSDLDGGYRPLEA